MRTISRRDIPESPFVWTRGIASHETLRYLDRKGIHAAPLLAKAGLSRGQLSQGDRGVSIASQFRLLEHVDERRRAGRRYSLPGAPSVDPLDQLRRDTNVDICCFPFIPVRCGAVRHIRLIIPAKKLIDATGLAARGGDGRCLSLNPRFPPTPRVALPRIGSFRGCLERSIADNNDPPLGSGWAWSFYPPET
jgi:hypothetical protein